MRCSKRSFAVLSLLFAVLLSLSIGTLKNRPLPPLSQVVPNDIAANLFNSVGAVEISEYREPNSPILMARQCPS